jgi:carbamate kinase
MKPLGQGIFAAWGHKMGEVSGSMGPKIEPALEYLERGGDLVIITSHESIPDALVGLAGTRIAL